MSASPRPPSSASASPAPQSGPSVANKHAPTALEKQRMQLDKLLKDPSKPAHIPKAPTEKGIRAPREMMKNVQGSSAGAGSGEFHVYKQSRRREYERLKLMDENAKKEAERAEFEAKKRTWDETADAKTAKNRAKRQKRKAAKKGSGGAKKGSDDDSDGDVEEREVKKKRVLGGDGKGVVFRRPDEEGEDDDGDDVGPKPEDPTAGIPDDAAAAAAEEAPRVVETAAIIIHDD